MLSLHYIYNHQRSPHSPQNKIETYLCQSAAFQTLVEPVFVNNFVVYTLVTKIFVSPCVRLSVATADDKIRDVTTVRDDVIGVDGDRCR